MRVLATARLLATVGLLTPVRLLATVRLQRWLQQIGISSLRLVTIRPLRLIVYAI